MRAPPADEPDPKVEAKIMKLWENFRETHPNVAEDVARWQAELGQYPVPHVPPAPPKPRQQFASYSVAEE